MVILQYLYRISDNYQHSSPVQKQSYDYCPIYLQVPSEALNNREGGGASASLMSLSLRANKIEAIRTRAFHALATLTKLDLSGNRISAIEAGAFEGLKNLQRVYLHSNHLTTLSARDLPISLHGISVHENR